MASKSILTLTDTHQDTGDFELTDSYAHPHPKVVITGIQMSFGSMVGLALKWGTASLLAAAVLAGAMGAIYFGGSLALSAIAR